VISLHDTAQGRPVELAPREPGKFSFYACGPTVYDLPHLGHGRAILSWDILRRALEWLGFEVTHVSNITDIDDKIIERAAATKVSAEALAKKYEAEWWKAVDALGAHRPHHQPRATEYVDGMVELIGALIEKGVAYDTPDTVYFSPSSVTDYGLLARQTIESLQAGARVEADQAKRHPVDFALWKKAKGPGDVPQWPSPWGAGRPGWHTECVVMSLDILGDNFDLHGGGLDLMFPHHENERAQAMAMGHQFSHYWVHHGFIESGGEKMSKSLGNFTSLTDLLNRVDPRAYRLLILRGHYRSPIEVTPDLIADAEAALTRFDGLARRAESSPQTTIGLVASEATHDGDVIRRFRDRLEKDLDTPGALAIVFETLRLANSAFDSEAIYADQLAATVFEMAGALGLFPAPLDAPVPYEVGELVKMLDEARAQKDWGTADAARAQLQAEGWIVEQTKAGSIVRRA
jgi:cysteinyl-tRNA synthetase